MTIPTGDIYSWIKTGNSWSLNGCRDGWQRFNRSDGISVCMKTFYSSGGIRRWIARENYCKPIGTDQIGVASVEESQWIYGQMMQYKPASKTSFFFWADGSYKPANCNNANFCEKIIWKDGYTKGIAALNTSTNFDCICGGDYCPVVAYIPDNTTKTMTTVDCNVYGDGYVCGYDLKKSV
ncbi:hypothetical protein B9Z55_015645 [Caenorhabditis nigoni]|uniref:C-type lectin domain-containing protein n=1 Tax=Caenorhabditis nigoni TaxID=1611254 RepID=A0A2G5UB44_9PELO|nr:hypothetical protein B9Z55_015645 [Caenorhabditis nigoni]